MAITQISKIQVRRGLLEELPQLASGEFGWAIDAQRLFIGNGTYKEGAPELGNTEILTHESDVFSLSGVYTYKGERAGYIVKTGLTTLNPATRSMQDKFDDIVNFRDFNGAGDGVTNDVVHLNHAIQQLYKQSVLSEHRVRRTLHLSAGTYILEGDYIKLLPYVKLKGDGKNSTFIIQKGNPQNSSLSYPVVKVVDSLLHETLLIGTDAAILPGNNELEDLTLINETNNDVMFLESVTDIYCNRVRFKGNTSLPTTVSLTACVKFPQVQNYNSSNITFNNCEFINHYHGIIADCSVTNVTISNCYFNELYSALLLGIAAINVNRVPSSWKITSSHFDTIYAQGIISTQYVNNVVSSFNSFKNVGNFYSTIANPYVNIIDFNGNNSYSIGDFFLDRQYNATISAINLRGKSSFASLPNGQLLLGRQLFVGGNEIELSKEIQTTETVAGVVGKVDIPVIITYTIIRANHNRTGIMKVTTLGGSSIVYEDDSVESGNTGVTLIPAINNSEVELRYVTDSETSAVSLLRTSVTMLT
jgi:hypothetical protein